jgi:hypothetical protein
LNKENDMGLFFGLLGGSRGNWARFDGEPPEIGPLRLIPNGEFAFGPFRFDQNCAISKSNIGGAMVNKKAGSGQVLHVETPHGQHLRFKFASDVWWYDTCFA